MTNLKEVNIGQNKYCGPAVLSILTGKNTDECATVISRINGQYNVTGVQLNDLLRALDKMGFDQVRLEPQGSLYRTLVTYANRDGMYVVMIPRHYVCIEIKNKNIYFCDNFTKSPMPAASSARIGMQVLGIYQVIERPKPIVVEPPKPNLVSKQINTSVYKDYEGKYMIAVSRHWTYDIESVNRSELITQFALKDAAELKELVHSMIARLNIIKEDGV